MYLQIVVSINGSELHRYSFTESEVLVGRSSECDVLLDNAGVSRTHAKLLRQGERIQVVDLNSGNGTFLNGQWVSEGFVGPADTIGIGKFTLTAKLAAEALPDSEPHPTSEPEPVVSNTVFLRPEETRKILEKTQAGGAKPPVSPTVRPTPKAEPNKSNDVWIFAAGALVGLFCGWLFWG